MSERKYGAPICQTCGKHLSSWGERHTIHDCLKHALATGDPRHSEIRQQIEAARG